MGNVSTDRQGRRTCRHEVAGLGGCTSVGGRRRSQSRAHLRVVPPEQWTCNHFPAECAGVACRGAASPVPRPPPPLALPASLISSPPMAHGPVRAGPCLCRRPRPSRNGLHCHFLRQPQLLEEVRLGPDLRNRLSHIVDARNGVIRPFARAPPPHPHGLQPRRLASEDVSGAVLEVERLGGVDLQQLHGLLYARQCWLAHNWNRRIEFHVFFPPLSSLLRYRAVTVERLEAQDALEQILHSELLQHHVGVNLVRVGKDVLGLRHAL